MPGPWGDDLFERREFAQAAAVFVEEGATVKVRAAYERSGSSLRSEGSTRRRRSRRLAKAEAPAAFYDPALANVDVMTDASAFTEFMRCAVAASAVSSKATSKRWRGKSVRGERDGWREVLA